MIQTNNTPPAYGLDTYNQVISEEVSMTLRADIGGDNKAKVIIRINANDIPKD